MTSTTPPTTGDDLNNLLNENGGVGTWEQSQPTEVARWLFPRFPGAEDIGTCDKHTSAGDDTHRRTKKCENFVTDPGNMYLSRSGLGPYDTDVETVAAWLSAPRTIVGGVNLLGDPGTGKTALIEAAATHMGKRIRTHVCTPDDTRETLLLRFVGEGKGECINQGHPTGTDGTCVDGCRRGPYTYGPLAYACKYGLLSYMDEWMLLQDGTKPTLYPPADGRHVLPGGEIDGSDMEIHPGFRLVLSSNPIVRGASMPEPMASRFAGTTLMVETAPSMLIDLGIDESIVTAWETLKDQKLFAPAVRELRVADYWLPVDPAQAVSAFIGEHCPASDRKAVRDIVVGFLGGNIREDGRLVVS